MKKIITGLTLAGLLLIPLTGFAVKVVATDPVSGDIVTIFANIIKWILGFLVGFAVLMIIIAGYYFVSAQGDMDKVKTARNFILWALVGVLVGILSWVLVDFVQTTVVGGGNAQEQQEF